MGDHFLETKREYAQYVVKVVCEKRKFPIPSFNFAGCPGEDENQLAHYHRDSNRICISKRQLNLHNFDELRDTMVHEAAHIVAYDHDDWFTTEEFFNFITFGELSVEAFLIERGREKKEKTENICFDIGCVHEKETRFKVPVVIIPIVVRSVTRHSNIGLDADYVARNYYLEVIGRGSNEKKAIRNFQEEFRKLWCWSSTGDEKDLSKQIQKRRLEEFIVERC